MIGTVTGNPVELVMWIIMGGLILRLSIIDWRTMRIPDKLLLLAAVNRLVFLVLLGEPLKETMIRILWGSCSVSVPLLLLVLLMNRLLGKETMGGGDIKLLFVMGMYMSPAQMVLLLLAACLLALPAALVWRRRSMQAVFPFGPFLGLGWFLAVVFGEAIIGWYTSLSMG